MSHTPEPCKRCGAYATLVNSLEDQHSHHRANADKYREAIATLESERDANRLLTAQITDLTQQRDKLLAALKDALDTVEWMHGCTAPADDEVERAIREASAAIAEVEGEK